MSDHHFNRRTCNCQSGGHSHHTLGSCQIRHQAQHHDFCSCNSLRHHRSTLHDTCNCNRVDHFSRNHSRRVNDRFHFNGRSRNFSTRSSTRMTPLRHNRHGDMNLPHHHHSHLHERNHSIGETIRLRKDDDDKKNIVIIM
ncbi:hypothetical protein IM538_05650 [Cytobacillus suaedae]|nr:hypothetical protein IM538_05650 [Cytobacillus suaedae]